MLALTRMVDESIIIDLRQYGLGTIKVLVVNIRGDKARLGFAANESIPIHRSEVFEAIERDRGSRA